MNSPKKICPFCKCPFEPSKYKKSIQYSCAKETCQRERHAINCKEGRKKNPDYDSKKKPRKRNSRAAFFRAYRANNHDYVERENQRRCLSYHRDKSSATQDSDIKIPANRNSLLKNHDGKHRVLSPTKPSSIQNLASELPVGGNVYSFIGNISTLQNSVPRQQNPKI